MKIKNVFFKVKSEVFKSYGKTLVIAEIGSNHNNNFNLLKKLVKIAKKSGCDAVKFQLFKAEKLVQKNSNAYKILKKLELSDAWIPKIKKLCKKNNLLFACSPFDEQAIKILKKNNCDIIKIASPEIKNTYLIKKAIQTRIPVIISTGDSDKKIIDRVLNLLKLLTVKSKSLAFLHCTSEYPAKISNINLNMIKYLSGNLKKFAVGFSDHSLGIDASVAAVSMGACIIEKHITVSRKLKGPDHFFAIEPNELHELVRKIRNSEKYFGRFTKVRLKSENTIFICAFSKKSIKKNKVIKFNDIVFKRSLKKGIEIHNIKKIFNKKSKKNYYKDEMII